jgi:hypothetical protein
MLIKKKHTPFTKCQNPEISLYFRILISDNIIKVFNTGIEK